MSICTRIIVRMLQSKAQTARKYANAKIKFNSRMPRFLGRKSRQVRVFTPPRIFKRAEEVLKNQVETI